MQKTALFDSVFNTRIDEVVRIHPWVKAAIGRRMRDGRVLLVSALCPDYSRDGRGFTYASVGSGIPFVAHMHLRVARIMQECLKRHNIEFEYHITLADTEFDLPLVMNKLADGSKEEFLRKCQSSCNAVHQEGVRLGLNIGRSERFTIAFPDWFTAYEEALHVVEDEIVADSATRSDLAMLGSERLPLYQAMASGSVPAEYGVSMVKRQWAQYMTWGRVAEQRFGPNLIMLNHRTPNLTRVNHPGFRKGKERIPILELPISTMPVIP